METVQVSGEHVFDELARYRQEWRTTHRYPFIIGNDRDLENLREICASHRAMMVRESSNKR